MIERFISTLFNVIPDISAEAIADALFLMATKADQPTLNSTSPSERIAQQSFKIDYNSLLASQSLLQIYGHQYAKNSPKGLSIKTREDKNSSSSDLPKNEKQAELYASSSRFAEPTGSLAFRVPNVSPLLSRLELSRSLRSLRSTVQSTTHSEFDEYKTAQLIAETDFWIPVVRKKEIRRFDVVLITDEVPSMGIWRSTVGELYRLFEIQGAFRQVHLWQLHINEADSKPILLKRSSNFSENSIAKSVKEIIYPYKYRRLILLISDCVSLSWYNGAVQRVIEKWSHHNLVTIVQVLPSNFWSRTALRYATSVTLRANSPGTINRKLSIAKSSKRFARSNLNGLPIPIVQLQPQAVDSWAQMVAGKSSVSAIGFILASSSINTGKVYGSQTVEERLARFRATASPLAIKLAGLLSAIAPLNFHVMRLIQQTSLPDSNEVHLAEVILSGLLHEIDMSAGSVKRNVDDISYMFYDVAREALLNQIPISETMRVVSEHIDKNLGSLPDFKAWINGVSAVDLSNDPHYGPFAHVTASALRRLGGEYADLGISLPAVNRVENRQAQTHQTGSSLRSNDPLRGREISELIEDILGPERIEFCNHLGKDWDKLAMYLGIPKDRQSRFKSGREGQAILAWLDERRSSIIELMDALTGIKRDDLIPFLLPTADVTTTSTQAYEHYYQTCQDRWSQPRYALDQRLIRLTLLLDQGDDAQGLRWAKQDREFKSLQDVLDHVNDQAIVILGAPGSGKSTLLRHYELENAQKCLTDNSTSLDASSLTFFVSLNSYKPQKANDPLPNPLDWLSKCWASTAADLPPLLELLKARRMTLLLDALNEIPYPGTEPVTLWKEALKTLAQDYPGNRMIFSCRTLDYSATLSTKELPVPQVRIVSSLRSNDPLRGREISELIEDVPGPKRIEFCNHLGEDWDKLAIYLGIPKDRQNRFKSGREGQAILAWLDERRSSITELTDALTGIKRDDLIPLLLPTVKVTPTSTQAYEHYYQICQERWSEPRYALDQRFVRLTLLLYQGDDAQGLRWAKQDREFKSLQDVLDHVNDQALVVLGAPGSGKSTLLRHYELENAQNHLSNHPTALDASSLTFFVSLNSYKPQKADDPLPAPLDWLSERWAGIAADLPPLRELLKARRMTLLLDALNEIPYPGTEPVQLWKEALQTLAQDYPGNRMIFSCRSLDYSATLSTKELPVPQVRIESLSDAQIQQFIEHYCPEHAEELWSKLDGTPQLDVVRSPYFLKLLVEQSQDGEVPNGRAALFTGFVRQAIKREILAENPLFQPGALIHQRDHQRILQALQWKSPSDLPERSELIPKLSQLAFSMQDRRSATEAAQVRVDYDEAIDLIDDTRAEEMIDAGVALNVLEQDLGRDEVLYIHQLLQEYFAARTLAQDPQLDRVHQHWHVNRVSPSLVGNA